MPQAYRPPRVRSSQPPGSEIPNGPYGRERRSSEYDEVKGVALNLTRSPEKIELGIVPILFVEAQAMRRVRYG